MPEPVLVSAVIPAYNPTAFVEETIASIQAQTHPRKEIILVDDGTTEPESLERIAAIEARGIPNLRVVRQENRGLAGARNTGFRHARGKYVVPIDADDLLEPGMMEVCLREIEAHPEAGFCYFDYRVFGDFHYVQRPGEYNLYRLLDENFMACCIFIPRATWEAVGGYDDWHRWGYEDWSFFINLGKNGYFGHYVRQPLFAYRTHGRGLHYIGLERHATNWAHMTEKHPDALLPEGRLRIKRVWAPSICMVVQGGSVPSFENQTVRDYQILRNVDERAALVESRAAAFLWLSGDQPLAPQAAEECIWGLSEADWVTWQDTGDAPPPSLKNFAGPLGVSRPAMQRPEPKASGIVRRLPWRCRTTARSANRPAIVAASAAAGPNSSPQPVAQPQGSLVSVPADSSEPPSRLGRGADRLYHHLQNAELLSREAWLEHPLRSSARLIPLRWKERVNKVAGKPVFDLSFYLKFQPRSVLLAGALIERLDYITPPRHGRRRIGLFTPHLGVGGAENVLLEFASQIDRAKYEVLLIATQSADSRLLPEWRERVDWTYDLAQLVPGEKAQRFLYSIATNWELDVVVMQNSAAAYSILPALKEKRPELRVIDILHAVDQDWDFFAATLAVAEHLDRRIVISEAGRNRLAAMETPEEKIRLIPNGVDLQHFDRSRYERGRLRRHLGLSQDASIVLFAGRLDPIKRPLLLPEVARELKRLGSRAGAGIAQGRATAKQGRAQKDTAIGRGRAANAVHFVIAGDGPDARALRSSIQIHHLEQDFTLLGYVPDIVELLADADVLVIPSKGEGIPLVLLEALAMQVPVVACRAGAIEEALPLDCGVLVEPGLYEETRLAEVLLELLDAPERRAKMGERGREFVARTHAIEDTRSGYASVLDEIESKDGISSAVES